MLLDQLPFIFLLSKLQRSLLLLPNPINSQIGFFTLSPAAALIAVAAFTVDSVVIPDYSAIDRVREVEIRTVRIHRLPDSDPMPPS